MFNRGRMILMIVLLILVLPALSMAGTVDLPQTGQVTCYDAVGSVIACPSTGQDGDILAGVSWPLPRFTDNGDGTVTDRLTRLIWLQDAHCFGKRIGTTWTQALSDANSLADPSCSLTDGSTAGDWRLPNVNELESLINAEINTATWLNGQGFTNVQASFYWSSSTRVENKFFAWFVDFWRGHVDVSLKKFSYKVWPVRASTTLPAEIWDTGQVTSYDARDDGALERGIEWHTPRFTDNSDGTVTDNLTGLIWLRNANCFGVRLWTQALSEANSLADPSCSLTDGSAAGDWRLPNRKEFHSLTDFSQYNPALRSDHPFANVKSNYYWSSSTYAIVTQFAWDVNMYDGLVDYDSKLYFGGYVWPVRAGH
ncbi:MAG TPA: DUF1566 domain-containing protein [Desulfobacterales bacterium]|nr:DUF1566 domain-containing protein [Desulfobacterales bacterium]